MYRVNHLVYRYQTKPVFSPCNLEIARGEYLVLMGDNGSGKSTFFKFARRFFKTFRGNDLFYGTIINGLEKRPYS